jgi:hypothetical protein
MWALISSSSVFRSSGSLPMVMRHPFGSYSTYATTNPIFS